MRRFYRLVVLISLLLSVLLRIKKAIGDELPAWILQPPSADSAQIYYLGVGHSTENEVEAIQNAIRHAKNQAITDQFGTITQVHSDSYQTMGDGALVMRNSERSDLVQLVGFRQEKIYSKQNGRSYRGWALFSYARNEIEKEKARQRDGHKNQDRTPATTALGLFPRATGNDPLLFGSLQINTEPPGADILIDGKGWGESPASLESKFKPGSHTLEIRKKGYTSISETVITGRNRTTQIHLTLVPAKAKIRINPTPKDARIRIGGREISGNSWESVTVLDPIVIEVKHPDYHEQTHTITLDEREEKSLDFSLTPKNGYLTLRTEPSNAWVTFPTIQGTIRRMQTPILALPLPPGIHTIQIERAGYQSQIYELTMLPNRSLTPKTILLSRDQESLASTKDIRENHFTESSDFINSFWTLGLGTKIGENEIHSPGGVVYGLDVDTEFRIIGNLGIRMGAAFDNGELRANNSTYKSTGYSFTAGAPLRWSTHPAIVLTLTPTVARIIRSYDSTRTHASLHTALNGAGLEVGVILTPGQLSENMGISIRYGLQNFESIAPFQGDSMVDSFGLGLVWRVR